MTLRDSLTQVDLFRALPDSALDEIMGRGTTFTLQPGTTLVLEGSTDEGFQIVRRGSATIVAGPDGVETFAVSALEFASLMDRYPQIARALLPVLTARIRAAEAPQP